MAPNLAQFDRLLDLLAEHVVRELLEETQTKENPHADQSCAGFQELNDAKCTPKIS